MEEKTTMTFAPVLKTYLDYNNSKLAEDVEALMNNLVTVHNVPNDIFEHLRLKSLTRYYVPLCIFAGEMMAKFTCEKNEGDQIIKISDVLQSGVFLKIPCHVKGACPAIVQQSDEILEQISLGTADETKIKAEAAERGWQVEFPEGVDADTVVKQYESQMLDMLRKNAEKIIKDELGNVSKLKINDISFNANGIDEHITGANLCRQPVSVIEYEYKGITYQATYQKGQFIFDSYPEDDSSKEIQTTARHRLFICAAVAVLILVLQGILIHSWPVSFLLLVATGGVAYKFYHDLSKMLDAATDVRGQEKSKHGAEEYVSQLKK